MRAENILTYNLINFSLGLLVIIILVQVDAKPEHGNEVAKRGNRTSLKMFLLLPF